ncbi:MAG: PAS domain S-box protein [Deinococcales bacterium]|nr:PAS domain S-box protein [Chitinophagaceae bacterium]
MRLPNTKIFVLSALLVAAFFARLLFTFFKQPSAIKSYVFSVQHTNEVLYKSEKVFSLINNYDNDILALQITNSNTLKQESTTLKQEIKNTLFELKQLTTDNLLQQQNIASLTNIITKKFLSDDAIINFTKFNNAIAVNNDIINSNVLYLKVVKRLVTAIQFEEEKVLVSRQAKYNKVLLEMNILFYTLGFIILVLLVTIVRGMQKLAYDKKTNAILKDHSALIDLTNEAIVSTDDKFNILQWSKGAETLYGYKKEEVTGKNIINFVASKMEVATSTAIVKEIQTNGSWKGEVQQYHKNGNALDLDVAYSKVLNTDGTTKGYFSTRADITEFKKIQADLLHLNNDLALEITKKTSEIKEVFERMQKAFLAFDTNWYCTYANQPILDYLKVKHEDIIGKHFADIISGIANTNFYKACFKALETQKMQELQEFIPFFNCWFESSIYPSTKGVSIYISDITEQKRAEQELFTQKKQLRNLTRHIQHLREEERKIIARELHDDLGQIVTVLKIDIRSLKNSLVNSSDIVLENVNQILETVDGLIKKIRKIAHQLRPNILDTVGLQAALKCHCLEFEKNTGVNCFFYNETNNERLSQDVEIALFRICQESLTNVMRHADATEVVVRLSKDNDEIVLEITDNGNGFDMTKTENTLGLVGIKERAASIKILLTIESAIGNGTTILACGILKEKVLQNDNIYNI